MASRNGGVGNDTGDFAGLVDDRPEDGVFQVDRRAYNDPDVLEAEFKNIFEAGWVFLCLEGFLKVPGDYVATHIGRQPIFVIRRQGGELGAFINACAHRGAMLTKGRTGNMTEIACPYHDWRYNTDGKCTGIKTRRVGWPEDDFDQSRFNLKPIARLESYRGFVFGSLNPDVPTLTDHMGPITKFLDIFCAPAPHELEIVAGAAIHTANCNWKVLHENGPDPYHASTVHGNFAATIKHRDETRGHDGLAKTETGRLAGTVATGMYAPGNGHTAFWADKESPEAFPVYAMKEQIERDLPPGQAKWALERSRHVTMFPNFLANELASTYIRTYRPLSVDATEISSWCLAPVGEADDLRAARLRKFEDFFMPTGMSTPDDIAVFESAQRGNMAGAGHANEMTRGMSQATPGPDGPALELGIEPELSANNFTHEITLQGIYRQWAKMMAADGGGRHE
jgi:benzoate/toluate 1,2-dioxygenase alpha subunit